MMHRNQKILVTALWGLTVLAMVALIGTGLWARRQGVADSDALQERLAVLRDAPSFSLVDQAGRTVTDASLRGNVWIAMVFFSECPGVCPAMMERMREIQNAVTLPDVKVVSFTIDPEKDTPEVLKDYADRFEADESRWHLLTGDKETMFKLAEGFMLAAKPATANEPITHTQKVVVIDRANHVRGFYDTNQIEDMKQLAADIKTLAAMHEPS